VTRLTIPFLLLYARFAGRSALHDETTIRRYDVFNLVVVVSSCRRLVVLAAPAESSPRLGD